MECGEDTGSVPGLRQVQAAAPLREGCRVHDGQDESGQHLAHL